MSNRQGVSNSSVVGKISKTNSPGGWNSRVGGGGGGGVRKK